MSLPTSSMIERYSNLTSRTYNPNLIPQLKMHQDLFAFEPQSTLVHFPNQNSSTLRSFLNLLMKSLSKGLMDLWASIIIVKSNMISSTLKVTENTIQHLKMMYGRYTPKIGYLLIKSVEILLPPILVFIMGLLMFAVLKASLVLGLEIGYTIRTFGVWIQNRFFQSSHRSKRDTLGGHISGVVDSSPAPEVDFDRSVSVNSIGLYRSPVQYRLIGTIQGYHSSQVAAYKGETPQWGSNDNRTQVRKRQSENYNQHPYNISIPHGQEQDEGEGEGEGEGRGKKEEEDGDEEEDEISLWQDWIFALRWGVLPRWSIWPKEITEIFEHSFEVQERVYQQAIKNGELVSLP